MIYNRHSNRVGKHAFLAPSKPAWANYDEDKLSRVYYTAMAAQRGVELHELAHHMIRLGMRAIEDDSSFSKYVNDGIGYQMKPELVLEYSENCFGSADTLVFRNNKLRVHDLKTGLKEASFEQLKIYAALFFLEYRLRVLDSEIELRIYQNDEISVHVPDPTDILVLMDTIKAHDRIINEIRMEAAQ